MLGKARLLTASNSSLQPHQASVIARALTPAVVKIMVNRVALLETRMVEVVDGAIRYSNRYLYIFIQGIRVVKLFHLNYSSSSKFKRAKAWVWELDIRSPQIIDDFCIDMQIMQAIYNIEIIDLGFFHS